MSNIKASLVDALKAGPKLWRERRRLTESVHGTRSPTLILDSFGGPDVPFDLLRKISDKAANAVVTFGPRSQPGSAAVGHAAKGEVASCSVPTCRRAFVE